MNRPPDGIVCCGVVDMAIKGQPIFSRRLRMDLFFLIWLLIYAAGAGLGTVWAGRACRSDSAALGEFCRSAVSGGRGFLACFLPAAAACLIALLLSLSGFRLLLWPFMAAKAFCSGYVLSVFYLCADPMVRFPAICGIVFQSAMLMPVFTFLCSYPGGARPFEKGTGRERLTGSFAAFAFLALAALAETGLLRRFAGI